MFPGIESNGGLVTHDYDILKITKIPTISSANFQNQKHRLLKF